MLLSSSVVLIDKSEFARKFFALAFAKSKLVRAYLLVGNDKDQLAKTSSFLNQLLNCKNLQVESDSLIPCGLCQNCKWITSGTHPKTPIRLRPGFKWEKNEDGQVFELENKAALNPSISVETVRNLKSELLRNSSNTRRLVIVEDAGLNSLKPDSAAALLKIVEEGPSDIVFVFWAESREVVLPTIVSRTQALNLTNLLQDPQFEDPGLEELRSWVNSDSARDRMEQIVFAEKLSERESSDLIKILESFSADYANSDYERFFMIEDSISALRSYVRPRNLLINLFGGLVSR